MNSTWLSCDYFFRILHLISGHGIQVAKANGKRIRQKTSEKNLDNPDEPMLAFAPYT